MARLRQVDHRTGGQLRQVHPSGSPSDRQIGAVDPVPVQVRLALLGHRTTSTYTRSPSILVTRRGVSGPSTISCLIPKYFSFSGFSRTASAFVPFGTEITSIRAELLRFAPTMSPD